MRPSRQTIEALAVKQFGVDQAAGIMKLLDQYDDRERERVQMCILSLANGKIEDIKHYVQTAKMDYRDILYWADPDGKLT
ncbi:MAG: hypothetical protein ACREEE_04585 [Dongiaceae bacterium]